MKKKIESYEDLEVYQKWGRPSVAAQFRSPQRGSPTFSMMNADACLRLSKNH